eukprot:3413163-Pyramimonas_sp.AAC.1
MQLCIAQGAALSSLAARRGVDSIEGRCGASARRHAELPVGHDPHEGGGRRASASRGRKWSSLWSAIRV